MSITTPQNTYSQHKQNRRIEFSAISFFSGLHEFDGMPGDT